MAISLPSSPNADEDDAAYRPMAEINITPFVDVMLVLLVIFMVAAPLMIAGVPVELPQTSATRISQPRKPMVVTLTGDQQLYIRDELVPREGFVGRLAALRAQEGDNVVYVRADRKSPYGDIMEILGRVGEGGYHRISLLSHALPGGGAGEK
ncbi:MULTISPECIES: biopolymer transporter ExbD [Rhodomicrobium]|uniref:ExbD/TolR family protein n=1 Tax=Rhodomicrobium TaxID=1068 RepID=UPI000B4ABAA8|nr:MULTISPECIES: biopolymer transporter ExbD [Rhodomicrobium]